MNIYLFVVIGALVLWSAWGYFSSRVEHAAYRVVSKKRGYEIRQYAPQLLAQTTVQGEYREALGQGFRIIAGYIFGNNVAQKKVAMTAPVMEQMSEAIAMTAPVTTEEEGGARVISFVMPRSYTRETLPVPKDSRVKIVEVPEETMAALRFSWYMSARRGEAKKTELLALLARDGLKARGTPVLAGYNPPWTPPWMLRTEVLVRVEA